MLGQNSKGGYVINNRLLKNQGKLVVAKSVCTNLITAVYYGITTAYPSKGKTKAIIKKRYYQLGINNNIKQFITNYNACHRSKVPQDKALGLLRLLLILDRPQQYILVDFKKIPLNHKGINIVCVFVNRLGKRPILVPYNKLVDARVLAQLYLVYVYKYYRPAIIIVLDHSLQFILAF